MNTNPPSSQSSGRFTKRRKWILIGILSLFCAAIVCLIVLVPLYSAKSTQEALIRIPANASRETVRDTIAKYLGDDFAAKVIKASQLRGSDFSKRHGAYLLTEGISPMRAERKLAAGSQHPLKIVINGFRTRERLAEKIALKLDFSKDSLLKTLNNPEITGRYGVSPEEVLVLFPDATYEVYWNTSPEELLDKTASAYKYIWNEKRRKQATDLGLTPVQMMILCSIVDEESNKADDKGKIGRLYVNRLHKGMRLQADPTVKYAVGDFTIRRVLNEHLKKESPYNTYLVTGLPPGPIRTTGTATIDSVLNSAPNDYIYMCAKDDFSGYHAFASDYNEHLKNARKYQQALNRRGIKK